MKRRLVLASASAARLGLLRAAGLAPEVIVSGAPEDRVIAPDTPGVVETLARRKAEAVAADSRAGGALVLGCDSLLDVDGEAWGKPGRAEIAAGRWKILRGRQATLYTGHCLLDADTGRREEGVVGTVVHFGAPSDAEIDAYVASGEPLGVAGGFTLDGRGAAFVDGVDGDPSNVIGLSLALLRRLLAAHGTTITEQWVRLPPPSAAHW